MIMRYTGREKSKEKLIVDFLFAIVEGSTWIFIAADYCDLYFRNNEEEALVFDKYKYERAAESERDKEKAS